ncbi:MAG: calcineurin-like phosphoesterase C-terminal domain-containing protein [Janthinobacterium lividum]
MTDPTLPSGITRRQTFAVAAGLALTLGEGADAALAAPAAETATGTVFEDVDGNGRRGAASRGLPGVLVSNGRDVVKTDADGRWSLPVRAGDALFVIKPTGYMTPVDPVTLLPRFSHLHVPEGTPANLGFRFAGIAPTGPLPASIDFPLRRQDEAAQFDVLLFTDPQPETLVELGFVRDDVVATTTGTPAAFGITCGDLMFDDLANYARYNAIVGSISMPWYNLPGNHDMNFEAPDDTFSRETFKRVFGARYSAFQYGGTTFLTLDNVEYLGTDPTKPNAFGKYRGRFGADQLAFVRNLLANIPPDGLVVICHHIPLKTMSGTDPNTANTDTSEFLAAIASHPNVVSFSGHTHTSEHWYLDRPGGGQLHHHVLAAVSGSWWSGPFDERGIPIALQSDGAPNGFHVLSIDGSRYETTLVPARDPSRGQMRIMIDSQLHRDGPEVLSEYAPGALLNGPIARDAAASTRVLVNLFDGGPRSEMSMVLGRSGKPIPLAKVERLDPFVQEVYARNAAVKKPWVKPDIVTHLFQATLPADLPPGTHRISVTAKDEYGRLHRSGIVLEVTG